MMKRKQDANNNAGSNPSADDQLRELRGKAVNIQMPVSPKADKYNQQAHPQMYPHFDKGHGQSPFQHESQNNMQRLGFDSNSSFSNPDLQEHFLKQQQFAQIQQHVGGLIPTGLNQKEVLSQRHVHGGATVDQLARGAYRRHELSFPQYVAQTMNQLAENEHKQQKVEQQSNKSSSRNAQRKLVQSLQPRDTTSNQTGDTSEISGQVSLKKRIQNRSNEFRSIDQTTHREKRTSDILINNLEPHEIKALRVANPLHQAFNSHLQKVVLSVQMRRKGLNLGSELMSFQNLEGQIEIPPQQNQSIKSEADAASNQNRLSISFNDQKFKNSEMMPYLVQTPARVRQEARKELEMLSKGMDKNVRPVITIKPQLGDQFVQQPRVVDQVANLIQRVKQDKDKVFIPLQLESDVKTGAIMFKDTKNQEEVHNGEVVFSQGGFLSLAKNKNQASEFVSKETYIQEGVETMVLNQVPFFRKFLALKTFKLWKNTMQRNVYERNRQKLAQNYIFSKPIFSQQYLKITECQNNVRFLDFIDNKPGQIYGKHQQHMYEDVCKTVSLESKAKLEKSLKEIRTTLEIIHSQITADDQEFEKSCLDATEQQIIKQKQQHQDLILFSKARAFKDAENSQRSLMQLRHNQFNLLIQRIAKVLFENLIEAIVNNKRKFSKLLFAAKNKTQHEISVCLDSQGKLDIDPKSEQHMQIFKNVFANMEASIFKNFFLIAFFQDLCQLFFLNDKKVNLLGTMWMRREVSEIEQYITSNEDYNSQDIIIDNQITNDLGKLQEQLQSYKQIEEIYEFVHGWSEKRQQIGQQAAAAQNTESNGSQTSISQEIDFYKVTWNKLAHLNQIIEMIPSSLTKIGTIVMETASIKKQLSEMPRQIIDQIRQNVTQTIENETRILKEELCTTSDTLDKLPVTLNIYVDQVNTLKYLKQKQQDFKNKFQTIITLQQQCKIDGIKISLNLSLSIEEVSALYEGLPKLIEKAEKGLQLNKLSIEQNMFKSSQSLGLKIKAFEKKYVENYLQDKSRLDHCKETLEELIRRQSAIQDIKSKVVLYKEFLRILYEDDVDAKEKLATKKLTCADDCEQIEQIHKNTLKMWKVFLYWNKKRHLCFTTAFLELDLKEIQKAISKVNKFLAGQAKDSEIVAYKSQPITRAISIQVKETSVIVDFAKDLHKDTLQRRHWIQIFNLLKAPHLKNSTTFTIVDLREHSIQNHTEEVRAIIEHANTELKYETVFTTISKEWEESTLKIIPFKDQMDDFVIANSELMADAIEENISTLETIKRSHYTTHVQGELTELIEKLKTMLEHLLLWAQTQKYWVTLDPIYNSGIFKNFFDDHTQDFTDTRSQFRRIMWSSYRHPKTTFNLLIKDRLIIFQKLTHYYAMLQKQVNQFLEMKRLVFTRFYFLTDSQFLDFMMLANSNQDFSVYINLLFQGAQKLYVSRLLQDSQQDRSSMGLDYDQSRAESDEVNEDLETQLEMFIQNQTSDVKNFDYKSLDNVLAKPVNIEMQAIKQMKSEKSNNFADNMSDNSVSDDYSRRDSESRGNSVSESKLSDERMALDTEMENYNIFKEIVGKKQSTDKQTIFNSQQQDFIILGLVSKNKELFLFDRHISMSKQFDQWLIETEQAMQITVQKQLHNSIQRFVEEPLEEWVLDYPQQVSISVIHLILSQEINDILSSGEPEQNQGQNTSVTPKPTEGTVMKTEIDEKDQEAKKDPKQIKMYEEVAIKVGIPAQEADAENDPAAQKKGQRRAKNDSKHDKAQVSIVIRKRATNEPDLEIEEQQLQFLDDCFGEQAQVEHQLEEAITIMKKDELRMLASLLQKKNQQLLRRPDYKDTILQVLQHKGLHSLYLRLQFWINKLIKLLYVPKQKLHEKRSKVMELPGIQKMIVKSIILFLKHQQEQVELMIKLKIQKVFDFEWQSKMRLVWSPENEAQAACGGWTQNLGYEYLGTSQRLLLTPLTNRYFVFITSALRERQSAMIDCNLFENTATELIQEIAAMCSLPFKSFKCGSSANASTLTQLLNGCAMANTWMIFEHMDELNLATLQILVKEIQLLHQQFIVSGFSKNLMKQRIALNQGLNLTQQFNQRDSNFSTFGIFGSTSYRLQINETKNAQIFRDKVRATFRSIALVKPDMQAAFKNILFVENFTESNSTASLLTSYIERFYFLKDEQLRKTAGQNLKMKDAIEIPNLRQCIKLACIIRDQEFNSYFRKQLERFKFEREQKVQLEDQREIYVEYDKSAQCWIVKKKRKNWYIQERHRLSFQNQLIQAQKYKIEVDALKEATQNFFTKKFLGEFRQANFQSIKSQRNINLNSFEKINLKTIEKDLLNLVLLAFEQVVEERKELQTKEEIELKKLQALGDFNESSMRGKVHQDVELAKAGRIAQMRVHRTLTRKDSLLDYKPKFQSSLKLAEGQNDQRARPRLRHASFINLEFTTQREQQEEKFNTEFQNGVLDIASELCINLTEDQLYNCIGVVEHMKRSKGIAIVGPICSGKTQIVKLVTLALKRTFDVILKTSYVNLSTFSQEELYGPVLAFDQNSIMQLDQPLQPKSIFKLILDNYTQEKMLLTDRERSRLICAIYMDQQHLHKEITDCFTSYLQTTNLRERDYLLDQEFLLNFKPEAKKLQENLVQQVPIRFPNGNVTALPSDMYFFFECQSLKDVSPNFITQIGIVNTQQEDVTYEHMFVHLMSLADQVHQPILVQYDVNFFNVKECCEEFVLPFVKNLTRVPQISSFFLWNLKALTTQFFSQINAQLYKLEECCEKYKNVEEKMTYPIQEMERDVLRNLVLQAVVWSFGAVLNAELRKIFDDQLGVYKQQFNINFAIPTKHRYRIFEIFFDFDRLVWQPIQEKLEYKLKSYFEQSLQALLLPTLELSQAFFMIDNQLSYMKRDKELNKQFRLIGPSSSSKTVILNTFAGKVSQPVKTVSVPMTAYLTLDVFKEIFEQNYRYKRQNQLTPKDPSTQILLVIDDVHMQNNLKVELLEFIRSWCFCKGYFSVKQGFFKKVGDFGSIVAENSNFVATTKKTERFLYYATTLYCEQIHMESYKHFVQNWLTTGQWPVSSLISKYYLLISNGLLALLEKMKKAENSVDNFSFTSLTSFHFVVKFCANLVANTSLIDNKNDVFGLGYEAQRREEEAAADLFCYEIMRTFGDRIMRPATRLMLMEKLATIVQKEFLCSEQYNTAYIEQLILGDYHVKEANSHHKYMSISQNQRPEVCTELRKLCKKFSGNQFLPIILDVPTGLADCYRVCRILYKPQQHLIIVGQPGVSKIETVQLAAIINQAALFEIDVPTYGEPLQFAYNFRQILLSIAKFNSSSYVVLNDQAVRDPVYYDYVYSFMSQMSRNENFVIFDRQFYIDLAAIEAQHIKKMAKVAVPKEDILFKQAVQKLQKHVHLVFIMNDLMSYKEIITLHPQLEYMCEVCYFEDLTQQDYLDTAQSFLVRSNLPEDIFGDDQQLSKSFVEVRNRVKQLLLKSFYSSNMLRFTVREEYLAHGASEFIFNNMDKLTGKIYSGSHGYFISNEDLQQVVLNMPLEVSVLNKHKFGVMLEVFRHLYELISMHLSIRKSYYETFLAKSRQFTKYFGSVKESKKRLYEDKDNHSFRVSMATDKIKEIRAYIQEKQNSIQRKTTEIEELQEELGVAEQEVEVIINVKQQQLDKMIAEISQIEQIEMVGLVTQVNQLSDAEIHLLRILQVFVQMQAEPKFSKTEAVNLFLQREELMDILNDRRQRSYPRNIFDKLHEFVMGRVYGDYNHNILMGSLYNYLMELYRKLNIKNTMAVTFFRIRELRTQIDSCVFSINYARQSIEVKTDELRIQNVKLNELQSAGNKLSKKIEEAEISHMRTDQIYDNILDYSRRIQSKLTCISTRTQSLLGDTVLFAASVVYLGEFAPEEREHIRSQIYEYLTKVRNIPCNKMWIETSSNHTANPNKSMFLKVLKDLGLRDILTKQNLPGVLSNHQFSEALFCLLFAPSCPVVCDPTGVVCKFVQEKLFVNMEPQVISGADLQGNEKLAQNLSSNRPSIIIDVNNQSLQRYGLTHNHALFGRLAQPLYNGIDFDGKRLGQVKKIRTLGSFISHSNGMNKRMPILSAALSHISLYQAQIFQSTLEFQLNQDYLQNSTIICAAPSLVVETRNKLDENQGMIQLKELILSHLLPSQFDFDDIKKQISILNQRILQLEKNYENAFLIASGETLKNFQEYSVLRQSVEDIINAREEKEKQLFKYKIALKQIKLVTEASDVLFQMYLSLKLTGKLMQENTYSWQTFVSMIEIILSKLVYHLKVETYNQIHQNKNHSIHDDSDQEEISEVEIEIDNTFFKKKLMPQVHKSLMSSLKTPSLPIFNLVLALRLAQTYKSITAVEHQYILKQLVELKGFKNWRDPQHEFVKIGDVVDKMRHINLRRELLRLYPDVARQVFDQVEKNLGQQFHYLDASIFIQKDLKEKYSLSQIQLLTFGFMCPDGEFKSKLALFMYTQNLATFDFSEDLESLENFLKVGDWTMPVALLPSHELNTINLVTSLANQEGRSLIILRSDPSYHASKFKSQLFNQKITEKVNNQLQDFGYVKYQQFNTINTVETEDQFNLMIDDDEPIAKQNWLMVKAKEINLDEGKIFFAEGEEIKQNAHINQIVDAANTGSWVLVCPVNFPNYMQKLSEKLDHMKNAGQLNKNFRLIIDLQNFNENEVPEQFLQKECYKFNLSKHNYDKITTLNDVWSKVLDPQYLNILTDTQNGNTVLKQIEQLSDEYVQPTTQFMQVYAQEEKDQNTLLLFNKFVENTTKEYSQKLNTQRAQVMKLMQAERAKQLEAERLRKVQNEATLILQDSQSDIQTQQHKARSHIANEKPESAVSIPKTDSTNQMNELAGLIAAINESSQPRLTVVPSDGNLNIDDSGTLRHTHSTEIISPSLNQNASKKGLVPSTQIMTVIPEILNQQSEGEEAD